MLNGETTELSALETSEELRHSWLHTLELYPSTRSHIFRILAEDTQRGSVYVLRCKASGLNKIGFTAGSDPFGRLASLQTGSPGELEPVGYFSAASEQTESAVKTFFRSKRVRGEWFALSPEDVGKLLNEDWRVSNNIF